MYIGLRSGHRLSIISSEKDAACGLNQLLN